MYKAENLCEDTRRSLFVHMETHNFKSLILSRVFNLKSQLKECKRIHNSTKVWILIKL